MSRDTEVTEENSVILDSKYNKLELEHNVPPAATQHQLHCHWHRTTVQLEGAGEIGFHWEKCAAKESYTGLEGMLTFR